MLKGPWLTRWATKQAGWRLSTHEVCCQIPVASRYAVTCQPCAHLGHLPLTHVEPAGQCLTSVACATMLM